MTQTSAPRDLTFACVGCCVGVMYAAHPTLALGAVVAGCAFVHLTPRLRSSSSAATLRADTHALTSLDALRAVVPSRSSGSGLADAPKVCMIYRNDSHLGHLIITVWIRALSGSRSKGVGDRLTGCTEHHRDKRRAPRDMLVFGRRARDLCSGTTRGRSAGAPQVRSSLDDTMQGFVARSPFVQLATADTDGQPQVRANGDDTTPRAQRR